MKKLGLLITALLCMSIISVLGYGINIDSVSEDAIVLEFTGIDDIQIQMLQATAGVGDVVDTYLIEGSTTNKFPP